MMVRLLLGLKNDCSEYIFHEVAGRYWLHDGEKLLS